MTVSTLVETRVRFLDLQAQYASIKGEIEEAVHAVLESGHFVGGEWIEKFENEFAQYTGAKYALAVGSGTAALELAFKAAHIGPGDEVIVPANSFFATAEAVSNIGATPVFADVDPVTFHLNAATVEPHLTPKTRAIVPVHLYGRAVDLKGIERLAEAHDLQIIEDACQAHGANFKGEAAINTKAFSFYPTKNLGALGEGGLVMTNDEKVRDFAATYRNYGQQGRYNHVIKGNNYRADALQCVLLDIKLKKLNDFIGKRRGIAQRYIHELGGLSDLALPEFSADNSYHLFVIRVLNDKRDALRNYLKEQGIETLIHYPITINKQPCYREEYTDLVLEKTDSFQPEILSLPCYPFLKDEEQDFVIAEIKKYLS